MVTSLQANMATQRATTVWVTPVDDWKHSICSHSCWYYQFFFHLVFDLTTFSQLGSPENKMYPCCICCNKPQQAGLIRRTVKDVVTVVMGDMLGDPFQKAKAECGMRTSGHHRINKHNQRTRRGQTEREGRAKKRWREQLKGRSVGWSGGRRF